MAEEGPSESRVESLITGISGIDFEDIATEDGSEPSQLPNVIIVTNIAEQVFDNDSEKVYFESLFRSVDSTATFHYLKSFRRARVQFESPNLAIEARLRIAETDVSGQRIKCFFAQPLQRQNSSPHLQLPEPVKQFLISPPASPPIGWEPAPEAEPVINYDLLQAMATLSPGESHELHPPSDQQPGIVVHICEEPEGFRTRTKTIQQTRRPVSST